MHCNQCTDRIHLLLDDRIDPLSDIQVATHVESCPACSEVLASWLQINTAFCPNQTQPADPLTSPQAQRVPQAQKVAIWLTLAAAITWMVFTTDYSQPLNNTPAVIPEPQSALVEATTTDFSFEDIDLRVSEPKWWGEMAAATLRPVQPLAEGFRPLTSSFQSAFQILAPKPTSSTQQSQPPASDLPSEYPEDFSAQRTSSLQRTA